MKEKAPLGNPFIWEPRGGWVTSPCGHCPSTLSQRCVVVDLKREIVEGKGGQEGEGGRRKEDRREKVAGRPPFFGRPAMLGLNSTPTFILHFILLLSCLLH
jgi:hypothetical protein